MTGPIERDPFHIYPIDQVIATSPVSVPSNLADIIPGILAHHLPGKMPARILDRGEWGRRIFEVTLDTGETVMIKFVVHEDWLYGHHKTRALYRLLTPHGLCATEEIASDYTKSLAPLGYAIEKKASGIRLDRLLKTVADLDRRPIYQAIGRHYRRLHSILGKRAGYWMDDPDQPFEMHPNEFYLQNEIGGPDGSGWKLVKMGILKEATLERLIGTWRRHLEELKDHPAALVHGNATPWSIYLEKTGPEGNYRVSRMGAEDCLWWDPAYDLAMLRWPPLADIRPEDWQALAEAYGPLPAEHRLLLYRLMQSLLTACWAYMGPKTPESDTWLGVFREKLDANLNAWIDQVEGDE